MEILISLGIFAVGLVAVAAVFPTAIAIQRETVRDLAGQRIAANAQATIKALAVSTLGPAVPTSSQTYNSRTLTYKHDLLAQDRRGTLKDFTINNTGTDKQYLFSPNGGRTGAPGRVQPMIDQPNFRPQHQTDPDYSGREMSTTIARVNAVKSFHYLFSEGIRSYPKTIPRTNERDYYWYPFIQAKDLTGNSPTWVVYLMIMRRSGTEAPPEPRAVRVTNVTGNVIEFDSTGPANDPYWLDNDNDNGGVGDGLPDVIQPGDFVLADDGSSFRVILAEKDRITVESQIPASTAINFLYYAVALEGGLAYPNFLVKREARSPIIRIEQFELVVNEPQP